MSAANDSAKPRGIAGLALIALVMVGVLVSLGAWQLQRRSEKHALIAALNERLAQAPSPLPPPAQWTALTPARDEFRRVRFRATYLPQPDAMIYSSGSALRADVSGLGTWALTPARTEDGTIVVIDVGFVPNTMQDRAQQDRAVTPLKTDTPVQMTGYLRFPETAGALTPSANIEKRLWFARDVPAIAKALDWGEVAPFYVDLEAPVPPSGVPKPGPLDVRLKDNHLQYAITWFALALVVAIGFGAWLRQRVRS